jgi:hypothetical protein
MKTPLTIKVDQSFFDAVDRARTATPVHQSRSEFIRNAVTSYLVYFESRVMPTLRKQARELSELDEPMDFYVDSGGQDYERWF